MMDTYSHYMSGMTPSQIAEHLKQIFPEFGDLEDEEILLQQASALSYIESNRQFSASNETGPSRGASDEHLELDEAIARSLSEIGDDFHDFCITEHGGGAVGNEESTFRETHTRAEGEHLRQDDFDPDRMTYEELQSLGESVGSESKGLPADLISRLPTFKYKVGLLSKFKGHEKQECVICYSEYKNGSQLTSLPCAHNYHANCITRWLQDSKTCPMCLKEVVADSFSS